MIASYLCISFIRLNNKSLSQQILWCKQRALSQCYTLECQIPWCMQFGILQIQCIWCQLITSYEGHSKSFALASITLNVEPIKHNCYGSLNSLSTTLSLQIQNCLSFWRFVKLWKYNSDTPLFYHGKVSTTTETGSYIKALFNFKRTAKRRQHLWRPTTTI